MSKWFFNGIRDIYSKKTYVNIFLQKSMKISVLKYFKIFTAIENHFDLIKSSARFSKAPKSFRTRKAIAKSRTLWLQSCFIHTRNFRRKHFSVFRYSWAKNGFTGPKSFWGFRETGPSPHRVVHCRRHRSYPFEGGQEVFYAILYWISLQSWV